MAIYKLFVMLLPIMAMVKALPQVDNTLIKCEDPIIDEMEDNFGDCKYVLKHVACLTKPKLKQCLEKGKSDEGQCCDDVGNRLKELAPVAIDDRDESACEDKECVCVKRTGGKILDRLKKGRSDKGVRYSAFHDHVSRYFAAIKTDPKATMPFPTSLEKLCQ